jgi:hypothetical protein
MEAPIHNPTDAPLTPVEQRAVKAIIDDFLVNDDNTVIGCGQYFPAIARDPSGNFVIAWQDDRNALTNIYAQRFDSSGVPLGSNFKVNDSTIHYRWSSAMAMHASVSMSSSGNFIIAWTDWRNDNWDIYAQRYDAAGNPLGSNFKVNNDVGTAEQYWPAVAMNSAGYFVITWHDFRNGNWDIYAQRYNSTGVPTGSNFKVNNDATSYDQVVPDIAMDDFGNFVITWSDYRNYLTSDWDIYARRYDSYGNPLCEIRVNDTLPRLQGSPAIGMDNSGNFVIVWDDYRHEVGSNKDSDIYYRRFNSSCSPFGPSSRVNKDLGTAGQYVPDIAVKGSGDFVVTWYDNRNGDFDIFGQRYDSTGASKGGNFRVNDDAGTDPQERPAIAMDNPGNFVITWQDYRDGYTVNCNIYAQKYNSFGATIEANSKVNTDTGTVWQFRPDIAVNGSGKSVITWRDDRNGVTDIYAQRFDSTGSKIDTNFRVTDDTGPFHQDDPDVGMDSSGNFVITWYDNRNGNYDIFAQMYNSLGIAQGTNIKVNDNTDTTSQQSPVIAMGNSGNFVIAWQDYRNGNWDIYARRYSSLGSPLGNSFKVNCNSVSTKQYDPAIAMDGSGNLIITWTDTTSGDWDIYARRYNPQGSPDTCFRVNTDIGGADQCNVAVGADSSDKFVISWSDYRNGNWDIFYQRYDSSGNPVGSNRQANDDAGTAEQGSSAVTFANAGNFIITWDDGRNGNYDIYAQRCCDSSGNKVGSNYLVTDTIYAFFTQAVTSVATKGCRVYFTWQDNRRAKGWDIYAKVVYFQRGDVNGDCKVSLSDVVYLINYLFKFGPKPICETGIGDANCDGKVSLGDIVYLINYLFKFGPPPCP